MLGGLVDPVTLYAQNVLSGEEVAGPWVRAACKRHMADLRDGRERGIWFSHMRAALAFMFFQEELKLSEGQFEGRDFRLEPSQFFIIGSLFGWLMKDEKGETVRRFRRAYIEQGKGNGKALSVGTPISTPAGWRTMGDLQAGDIVFDDTGAPCNVTAVSGHMFGRPCYRVRFSDGAQIIADADHLWKTTTLRSGRSKGDWCRGVPKSEWKSSGRGSTDIRTTAEISRTLTAGPSKSKHPQAKWNHRVDVAGALDLPAVDLPVPPYVFGAWLGDGDSDCARITIAYSDWQIVENIEAEGVQCSEQQKHSDTTARVLLSAGRGGKMADKVNAKLRELGVFGKKFIPVSYLRASSDQRMALLQGLMDTDGTIAKNGQCELTLCSSGFSDDAVELIASLGFKPTRKISESKLNGRVVGMRHRIQFWAYRDRPVFRLTRKASRQPDAPATRSISQGRMIVACDPVPSVPVKCISVDSPSRMFLCGRAMIPTHNSPMVGGIGLFGMMADREPGAQIYSAGATFDQASILFNDAVKMAQQSGNLWENITPSGNAKILNLAALGSPWHGAFFRPLSREKKKTGSGPRPHMALCDELHEHPDGGVVDMLERGFKFRRQPLLVMITNSGSDRKSFCWEEHEHAIAVATGAVKDDRTFSYVCALDEGDDPLTDPSCWKKANPLLGVTITNEYLRGVVKQALDLPSKQNNILRLHFCQWTDSATAWLPRAKLEACEDPAMTIEQFAGKRCHAGLDLSATKDLTAKALVFDDGWKDVPDPEKTGLMKRKPTYALFVKAWTPAETLRERQRADKAPYDQWVKDGHLVATPGPVIRLDFVAADLKDDHDRYELAGVAYDRYLIRAFERDMAEIGIDQVIPMHDHPQSVARRQQTELWMPGSVDMFETLVLEGRIRIAVNPVLRSAIAGATFWESPAGLKRFEKSKATNRIDPCVAAAMAIGLATLGEEDRTSVYDTLADHEATVAQSSVYELLEVDYKILNDVNHPKHREMLARFHRKEAMEDAEMETA